MAGRVDNKPLVDTVKAWSALQATTSTWAYGRVVNLSNLADYIRSSMRGSG